MPAPHHIFADQAQLSDDVATLDAHFTEALKAYGYDKFIYVNMLAFGGGEQAMILTTVPSEWFDHYFAYGYEAHDPVAQATSQGGVPVRWEDCYEGANQIGKKILDEARAFGLTNGLAVPLRGSSDNFFLVMMSGRPDFIGLAEMMELQGICAQFHHFRRLLTVDELPSLKLTPKQREYLTWAAEGKTANEIAQIAGVSEGAVQNRLQESYRRLNVRNLQGAIARAMGFGLIQPKVFIAYTLEETKQ